MSKQKIDNIKKRILPTLKKYDVVRASLFGSYARGEETKRSDIDMMVEFSGRKSLLDLVGLKLDLEEKVGKKFDVSTFKAIHYLIRDQVFKEQITILE